MPLPDKSRPKKSSNMDRRRETASDSKKGAAKSCSCCTRDGRNRQISTGMLVVHHKFKPHAGLPLDQHLGQSTRGRPRPQDTRLKARTAIGPPLLEVDLRRRPPSPGRVRPVPIMLGSEPKQILSERLNTQRHDEPLRTLHLDRLDESLHHGNAAMLADHPKPRANPFTFAPILEPLTPERLAFVGNQVLGGGLRVMHGASQEATDISGTGDLLEDGEAHGATRKVVEDDGHPVAEGPALRQREGQPRCPESQLGWYQGKINMPDMVDPLGRDHSLGSLGGNRLGLPSLFSRQSRRLLLRRVGMRSFLEDAADGGGAQVESGSAKHLSNLLLSQGRAESLQSLDEMADQLGKLVDRLEGLHKASVPSSSIRRTQELMVSAVTRKTLAVCSKDQPRVA